MDRPQVASRDEWLVARRELLAKEKEASRARDALSAERRRLPMMRIDKDYVFEGPGGRATLGDLFDGRRQLITYHFMFDPSWDEGCNACSFLVDNIGHLAHLHARDTSLALVSRAPLASIEAHKARMGWTFPWYSSFGSDFNYDFNVTSDEKVAPIEYNYRDRAALEQAGQTYALSGEQPGLSVFFRDSGSVFHTYSVYSRGLDMLLGTYHYLDLTPLGRLDPPGAPGVTQFIYHDGQAPLPDHRRST
ncbi:MAG: DUF899 domain-containing protein [Candidatus Dormibacteraeota bacterium]|nr:DUF899 domain-containing protein [Candidatus Dormibacteraeota bacterium]